ncbi:MAG TPA: copper resistance CopC family protein [Candidatus Angelobacter sp.]|nr:copper resistance CopC family protein [Candidatus Angelobacter sp.]
MFAAFSRRTSLLLILLIVVGAAQVCWAHAILKESTPPINSTVQGPNLDITLRYNVRIDGSRSRVLLFAPDGTSTPLTLAKQAKPDILQMRATGLKPGEYKLQWNVLASDGHMSKGDIPFTVK